MNLLKYLCFVSAVLLICAAASWPGKSLPQILQKLTAYSLYRSQEKLYLHLDRSLYASGEDVWFNAYLINATTNRLDSSSRIVYVELFDTEQKLLKRLSLHSPNGVSHGDFHLDDNLPQGKYLVRAYTNYMRNSDDDFFFSKEITVLNQDDSSKPVPAGVNGRSDLQFFPEGGNFVAGVENNMAFYSSN